MKKVLFIFFHIFIIKTTYGQTKNRDTNLVVTNPEVSASYPGGLSALHKYISDNVTYKMTFTSYESTVLEKVIAKFIIDENGYADSVKILKTSNIDRLDSNLVTA